MKQTTIKALYRHFCDKGYNLSDDDLDYIVALIDEDKTIFWNVRMGDRIAFDLKNGRQISLNTTDSAFVLALREQPLEFKIRAMDLTIEEIETYINEIRKELIEELKRVVFSKEIKSRETGEKFNFSDAYINKEYYMLEKEMTGKQIIAAITKKEITVDKGFKILRMILEETYF
jgi:hypothetical protein